MILYIICTFVLCALAFWVGKMLAYREANKIIEEIENLHYASIKHLAHYLPPDKSVHVANLLKDRNLK